MTDLDALRRRKDDASREWMRARESGTFGAEMDAEGEYLRAYREWFEAGGTLGGIERDAKGGHHYDADYAASPEEAPFVGPVPLPEGQRLDARGNGRRDGRLAGDLSAA